MSDEYTEQLKPLLQRALETMERQAHDMSLPASDRRESARMLARYKAIIKRYPFLMQDKEDYGTKKSR